MAANCMGMMMILMGVDYSWLSVMIFADIQARLNRVNPSSFNLFSV